MTVFIIRRLLQALVVVTLMSFLVFAGVFLIGDPVEIYVNDDADQEEREMIIKEMGLDKPFIVQYGIFLNNALSGDLGESFVFDEPALELILERMPATLELAVVSFSSQSS